MMKRMPNAGHDESSTLMVWGLVFNTGVVVVENVCEGIAAAAAAVVTVAVVGDGSDGDVFVLI